MKLVIGHLYHDLMNLYGDNGNIKVLEYQLKIQKIDYEIKKLSINDEINFSKLDLIYIGSGSEKNRDIVLKDILKYKKEIKECYKNNKCFLITGNAIELFGQYLIDKNNKVHKCLNLFNYYIKDEERTVAEIVAKAPFLKDSILGFVNHQGIIYSKNGKKLEGYGIYKNNFYGTYILGPILARNPEFLEFFLKKLIKNKSKNFRIKPIDRTLDDEAYIDFMIFKNNI